MRVILGMVLAVNTFSACDELARRAQLANEKDSGSAGYSANSDDHESDDRARCAPLNGRYRVEATFSSAAPSDCGERQLNAFELDFENGKLKDSKCMPVYTGCSVVLDCELDAVGGSDGKWWWRPEYVIHETAERVGTGEAHVLWISDRGRTCDYKHTLKLARE